MSGLENIGVIVLAAGSSSRLGQPKQLVPFQGKTLLQKAVDLMESFHFGTQMVVLGANHLQIEPYIHTSAARLIVNQKWSEGIASSIRLGVATTLKQNPQTEHLLLLLCDQPFVSSQLIDAMLARHQNEKKEITASYYQEEAGVPVIFAKPMFSQLLHLQGDQGAKKLLKQYAEKVALVAFDMGHIDVDTPDDCQQLTQYNTNKIH